MKRVVIFGAGQAGRMAAYWMPAGTELCAYTDNASSLWGTEAEGVKIVAPQQAVALAPDEIWIAVLNREAELQIRCQLTELGYEGPVYSVARLRERMDIRLAQLRLLARELIQNGVPGAVAELGVYQGETAAELNRLFPDRPLYLFDTFCGFDASDLQEEDVPVRRNFSDTNRFAVEQRLPYPEQARFFEGHFPDTLPLELPDFALVCVDFDLFRPTYEALVRLLPRLSPGGVLLLHDYNSTQFPGVKKAVVQYREQANVQVLPLCDLHGSAILWLEHSEEGEMQ